jgi:hypothetical protein
MADSVDAARLRIELNRALGADGISVGIRSITPTDVWVVAWRINGVATVRLLHVALDSGTDNLVRVVAETIRRDFRKPA